MISFRAVDLTESSGDEELSETVKLQAHQAEQPKKECAQLQIERYIAHFGILWIAGDRQKKQDFTPGCQHGSKS